MFHSNCDPATALQWAFRCLWLAIAMQRERQKNLLRGPILWRVISIAPQVSQATILARDQNPPSQNYSPETAYPPDGVCNSRRSRWLSQFDCPKAPFPRREFPKLLRRREAD